MHNEPDAPEAFARQVLAMPEQVAVGFLEKYHRSTCKCGNPDLFDALDTLKSMRAHWAGRL